MLSIRILIADDFEGWRNQVRSLLQGRPELQIICEVSDGAEAVQKSEELKPDLVLLDIGLPKLNGIEAARRIRQLSPNSKIMFISMENSPDVVQAALSTGSLGYVCKTKVRSELLAALEVVLQGKQFVSRGLEARDPSCEAVLINESFYFEFDPANKIVHAKFHGEVTDESIKDFYRAAASLAAATDFRGSIADFSGATSFHVTRDAISELAALPPADPSVSRPRVIVAPNTLIFGLARMFQAIGKATRPNLHIVRNLAQAFVLLGVVTPQFQPITPKS